MTVDPSTGEILPDMSDVASGLNSPEIPLDAFKEVLRSSNISAASFFPREIKRALPDLEAQCIKAIDAADSFKSACTAVAKRGGIDPAVLSAYIKARVSDGLEKQQTRATQMSLLLDNFG